MKQSLVLLCLLAIALPATASEPITSSACGQPALASPAEAPPVELTWLLAEPAAPPLPVDPLASVLRAHPCCPSNHTQVCSQACGGCGRGVCDDGACECLCC